MHICFGYAAIIHERPEAYSFLPELANSSVQQISIETAQSNLDCAILKSLPGKTIILGVLDLSTHEVETPEIGGRAHRTRARLMWSRSASWWRRIAGFKYLPRDVAFGKMKAMVAGAAIVREKLGRRA